MTDLLNRLAELDEETLHLDPENPADLDELHRIAEAMERLEDLLADLSHAEWQETFFG